MENPMTLPYQNRCDRRRQRLVRREYTFCHHALEEIARLHARTGGSKCQTPWISSIAWQSGSTVSGMPAVQHQRPHHHREALEGQRLSCLQSKSVRRRFVEKGFRDPDQIRRAPALCRERRTRRICACGPQHWPGHADRP